MLSSNEVIWHSKSGFDPELKRHEVCKVLKEDFHMKYHRVVKATPHLNTVRNRILRQQWVKEYLKALGLSKRFVCIDESWLEYCDGTTMVWSKRNMPNSVPSLVV